MSDTRRRCAGYCAVMVCLWILLLLGLALLVAGIVTGAPPMPVPHAL